MVEYTDADMEELTEEELAELEILERIHPCPPIRHK